MPFMIATYDKPLHEHVRDATRAQHFEFLEANVGKMIAGGGFWNNDGTAVIGGLMLLDVETYAEAEAFIAEDPFSSVDLFERVEIVRWKPAFFDYKRIPPPSPKP